MAQDPQTAQPATKPVTGADNIHMFYIINILYK